MTFLNLLLLALLVLVPVASSTARTTITTTSTTGHQHNNNRLLQQDVTSDDHWGQEAEEDLKHVSSSSFLWSGIYNQLSPGTYTLSLTAPDADYDPHAGHDHRKLQAEPSNSSAHAGGDEYHFLFAMVPVSGTEYEGLDQGLAVVKGWGGEDEVHVESEEEDSHAGHDHRLLEDEMILVDVQDGDTIVPSGDHAFEILMPATSTDSQTTITISITVPSPTNYVLFLPAIPSQVQGTNGQLLADAAGEGVGVTRSQMTEFNAELFETDEHTNTSKPWGTVIGACLLVNLVTLIGVIFIVPMLATAVKSGSMKDTIKALLSSTDVHFIADTEKRRVFDFAITSFACGALLATAVFLIIPEALLLVNDAGAGEGETDGHEGHDDHRLLQEDSHEGHGAHGDRNWVFGACFLAGFLFPMFLASFFPHHHSAEEIQHTHAVVASDDTGNKSKEIESDDDENVIKAGDTPSIEEENVAGSDGAKEQEFEINKRLVGGIIVGDALHNFADGIFIGVAFLLCDSALAWSVLFGTIYHELAQEVSDFFLLTQHAHLPPFTALALNFASGLSVLLGGLVVLATGVSNYAIGIILSMSAGVYINVAAKECMPTVDRLAESTKDRIFAFFCFALGAIPIGLVLLNHEHCEA